jgi:hypothetical protein
MKGQQGMTLASPVTSTVIGVPRRRLKNGVAFITEHLPLQNV